MLRVTVMLVRSGDLTLIKSREGSCSRQGRGNSKWELLASP